MLPRRRLRLAASGGVFLALLGVWLGHTAEYVRVAGTAGLRDELVGSIHWYMAPVGAILALLAAAAAVGAWRLWARLGGQLAAARGALARVWRGDHAVTDQRGAGVQPGGHRELRISRLWPLLTVVQIGLYVLQENIEAAAVGLPAPGLHALTGAHWAASLVHAAVALVLSTVVVGIGRALHRRSGAARAVRALIDVLLAVVVRAGHEHPSAQPAALRPADRFGRLWCRPPPSLLVTG